jgi:hypothetical protein
MFVSKPISRQRAALAQHGDVLPKDAPLAAAGGPIKSVLIRFSNDRADRGSMPVDDALVFA